MNLNGFDELDEILKMLGYKNVKKECIDKRLDLTAGALNNKCRDMNLDMPCGFQDVNPMLFTVIGEVISAILSGNMPTNVANAFGNWLQLVAQVIVTFNGQQSYFQSGPGRLYNPLYRNISNPFCVNSATSDGDEGMSGNNDDNIDAGNKKSKIKGLKKKVDKLSEEIEYLNKEITKLKNKK